MFAFIAVLLPMISGYAIMYVQGSQIISQRILSSMDTQQEYICNTIENRMFSIYTRQMDITLNEDIGYLIDLYGTFSNYERGTRLLHAQEKLEAFGMSSDWIEDTCVYIPSLNRTLCAKGGISELGAEYAELETLTDRQSGNFVLWDGKFFIISRVDTKHQDIRYLISVELSLPQIRKTFSYLFSLQSMDIVLYTADGQVLTSITDKEGEVPDYLAAAGQEFGLPKEVKIGGEEYFIRKDQAFFDRFIVLSAVSKRAAFKEIDSYTRLFWTLLLISSVFIAVFLYHFLNFFSRPTVQLIEAFSRVREGDFDTAVRYSSSNTFAQLYSSFNYTVAKLRSLVCDNLQQKILMQQMELRQLHAQVDPHFLHNSFLNICSMAQMEDYEGIQEMTMMLSQYYQYTTRSNQDSVRLEEEYRFISLYADIQNIRFDGRVQFELMPLPEKYRTLRIPKFLLQTLVENAYKYGAGSRAEDCVIEMRFENRPDGLSIIVEDNGLCFTEEKLHELNQILARDELPDQGTGLYNACRRIRLFYKNGSRMELRISRLGGLCVDVLIELNTDKEEGGTCTEC